MKRSTLFFTAALVAMISLGGSVRADVIQWQYAWQSSPVAVAAGTGGIAFTSTSPSQTNPLGLSAAGNSDIVATNLYVFSTASPTTPDNLGAGAAYSLTLTLTDSASGQSSSNAGNFTFTGLLTGTFSASNSNITNTFTSPTTESMVLGGNTYTVTIGPFSPPGPPSTTNITGSIAAYVQVTPGSGTGVQDVPEPSTMLLAGLGLSFLGGAAWRKRRQIVTK